MVDVGAALVARVEVKLDRLAKDLKKAGVLADDAIREIENKFKKSNPTFGSIGGSFGAGALGGFFSAGALTGLLLAVQKINKEFSEMGRLAKEVGVSVERLQEFRIAGGRLGVDAKIMDQTLDTLAKQRREAERNVLTENELEKIAKANNIVIRDRNGNLLKTEKILENLADLFQRVGAGERVDLAERLGLPREVIKFLEQGSAGVRDMLKDMKDVAIASEEVVRQAAEFDRKWNEAATSWENRMKAAVIFVEQLIDRLVAKLPSIELPKFLKDAIEGFEKIVNGPGSGGVGSLNIPAPSFITRGAEQIRNPGRAGQVLGGREARAVLDETTARERDLRGKIAELEQRITAAKERGDEAGVIALGSRIDGLRAKVEALKGAAAAPAAAKDVVSQVVGEPAEIDQKRERIQKLGDEIKVLRDRTAEGLKLGGAAGGSDSDIFAAGGVILKKTAEIQQLTGEVEKLAATVPKEPLVVTVKAKIDPPLPPRNERQRLVQVEGRAAGLDDKAAKEAAEAKQAQERLNNYIDTLLRQKDIEKAISDTLFLRRPEQLAAIEIARSQVLLSKLDGEARAETAAKIRDAVVALEEQREATEKARAAQQSLNQTIDFVGNSAIDALDRIIVGGEKFADVMKDIGRQFAKMILQAALLGQGPLAGLFGTGGSGGGAGGLLGALSGLLRGGAGGGLGSTGTGGSFARGGYTGRGNANDVAGIVHRGEYVFDADSTRKIGPQNLAKLQKRLRGYMGGGYVGPVFANAGGSASPQRGLHVTFGTAVDSQGNIYGFVKDVAQRESGRIVQQGMQTVIAGEPTRRRQYQARVA